VKQKYMALSCQEISGAQEVEMIMIKVLVIIHRRQANTAVC
jgi:hypothetical protein